MKTQHTLIIGAGLVLGAAFLITSQLASPSATTETPSIAANGRKHTRPPARPASLEVAFPAAEEVTQPQSETEGTVNLSAWQDRFGDLASQSGSRDEAVTMLLDEINATYAAWTRDQIATLPDSPAIERYDRLAEIEIEAGDGVAAILDQLGIDEIEKISASADAMDTLAAESQYAEAASDSESRMALLGLDRERESRFEQALALGDEAATAKAMAELDDWYDAGLGCIFASPKP